MKILSVITLIAMTTVAAAQELPQTADVMKNGEKVGTATKLGNIIYLRGPNGELAGTVELLPDDERLVRDPDGKLTGKVSKEDGKLVFHKIEE
jgi:hypothetical protein